MKEHLVRHVIFPLHERLRHQPTFPHTQQGASST